MTTGDVEHAKIHYQYLASSRGIGWINPITRDRLLGLLAGILGLQDAAVDHFEAAIKSAASVDYHLEEAWGLHDFTESLLASGRPAVIDNATQLVSRGLEIARELGLVAIETRLVKLETAIGQSSVADVQYPDDLTGREVDALRLIAAGNTNQQIADQLVIAPSTAAKHVSNILGKTGSSNRADAASYANRNGLLED